MSLISGNTFGQVVWSDNKSIAPMLPQVSFIQRCPACGKYYMLSRQKSIRTGKNESFDLGELAYEDLKEARAQFVSSEVMSENERLNMLIMLVWAFNDEYTRENEKPVPDDERAYITDIIEELLVMNNIDDLLKAELLRELGRFDEALEILDTYKAANDFLVDLQRKFRESALSHNTRPFVIS